MKDPKPILNADPAAAFAPYADEIRDAISRVVSSGMFIMGGEVAAFEAEFGGWIGAAHAAGVANGTDALEIALRAAGVRPGDGVIAPANTVSATISALVSAGARPVLADIDPRTMCIDAVALEALADSAECAGVRAIVPVHLYGQPCDMPALIRLAERRGWAVVEDCAQSHGARIANRMTGTWGAAAAFSFYPTKNLGALGDAGAVVTSDSRVAARVCELRQYGWRERYVSDGEGGRNSRLDEVQAAILRVQLRHLAASNRARLERAAIYFRILSDSGLILPPAAADGVEPVFHQFVVRSPRRDSLRDFLKERGVAAQVLYPTAIHHQPAFAKLERVGDLKESERACEQVLSLPVQPGVTLRDVEAIANHVLGWTRA